VKLRQTIQAFFAATFPLRLNKTVKALEESVQLEKWVNESLQMLLDSYRESTAVAIAANNEYRKDNAQLRADLSSSKEAYRFTKEVLNRLYEDLRPQITNWPMKMDPRVVSEKIRW
jgi:predicted trehalose synthase